MVFKVILEIGLLFVQMLPRLLFGVDMFAWGPTIRYWWALSVVYS